MMLDPGKSPRGNVELGEDRSSCDAICSEDIGEQRQTENPQGHGESLQDSGAIRAEREVCWGFRRDGDGE